MGHERFYREVGNIVSRGPEAVLGGVLVAGLFAGVVLALIKIAF